MGNLKRLVNFLRGNPLYIDIFFRLETKNDEVSENESHDEEKETPIKQNRIRRRAVDDEDDESSADGTILTNPMKALFSNKDFCDAETTDSDNERPPGDSSKKSSSRKKHSQKKTSEDSSKDNSSSSRATSPDSNPELETSSNRKDASKPRKEKKQSRKSKENAMKEIYSESNRMLRASAVGLPYHRPPQRTLDEFLYRKKSLPDVVPFLDGIRIR